MNKREREVNDIRYNLGKKFKNLTIPNCITYGGLLFALIGIYLLVNDKMILAIIFLTLTDVFDMLDGYIARKFKMFSPLGGDLDSLVDVFAFVVPPFIIALIFDNNILIVSSVFLVACSIYRLARFNVEKKVSGHVKGLVASLPPHFIYTAILLNVSLGFLAIFYVIFGMMTVSAILTKTKYTYFVTISIMSINLILAASMLVV